MRAMREREEGYRVKTAEKAWILVMQVSMVAGELLRCAAVPAMLSAPALPLPW